MNRIILIPIAGTIAAIVAVALAHGKQEDTPYPLLKKPTPPSRTSLDVPKTPRVTPEKEDEQDEEKVPPVVAPRRYMMEVMENGSFRATVMVPDKTAEPDPVEHESLEKFLEAAAPEGGPRPTVRLFTTSDRVTAEDLEKVAQQLRARCEVVIQKG